MYGGSYAWGQTAEGLQRPGDGRRRYRYECPPGGGPQLFIVTGTRVYTADSSICNAAVHCGVLNPEGGGPVMIEVRPGRDHYRGTRRHGITSYSLPEPWSASFVFVTPPSRPSDLDVKQVAGRCFKGMKYLRGAAAAERPAA
jgi:hypothetical protein